MQIKGLEKCKKFYFIGIGGVSMSALAKCLKQSGYTVSGSDRENSERLQELSEKGISIYLGEDGQRESLLSADCVIYTHAVSESNSELVAARHLKKHLYDRAEFLGLISACFSRVLSVAGSHGKTTCTAMCAHILAATKSCFCAHIGGEDATFGNFHCSGLDYFVTEACEYKKNLLKIDADTAILLNVDKDHMECYDGESDLYDTFRLYCQKAKTTFVCADDKRCASMGEFATFGIENEFADYRAVDLRCKNEQYSFTVQEYGNKLCRIQLNCVGRNNVYNALAAFAAMRSYGFDEREIVLGLQTFTAVKRRFERIGSYNGGAFVCDYAHHPKEILSSIKTAKGMAEGKVYVVFQPHTYSRTKYLMEEFVQALCKIDNLMIYKTYSAREFYDESGSAKTLAKNIGCCLYAENAFMLKTWLQKTVKSGDVALFLGAGDIYYAAKYILKELNG